MTVLCAVAGAESVPVVQLQGSTHGFLLLKDSGGKVIAIGDQTALVRGGVVHSRLIFHFHDGSVDDESTTFTEAGNFKLLRDRHIQKGPSFPKPLDVSIDLPKGEVAYTVFKDGKAERKTAAMKLPADLSNGLMSSLVENYPAHSDELKVSYLATDPKPRIVSLVIRPDGEDHYTLAGAVRTAQRFKLHVELGGIAGVIAPLIGKQPADMEVWVMQGEVPGFLRFDGPMYDQGPRWIMELTSPAWGK